MLFNLFHHLRQILRCLQHLHTERQCCHPVDRNTLVNSQDIRLIPCHRFKKLDININPIFLIIFHRETLDQDIIDARSTADQEYRKSVYKQCLDIILDWAVEIPIYQRQNCVIYSPERINADTFTKDVTTFYSWYNDITNIEMN